MAPAARAIGGGPSRFADTRRLTTAHATLHVPAVPPRRWSDLPEPAARIVRWRQLLALAIYPAGWLTIALVWERSTRPVGPESHEAAQFGRGIVTLITACALAGYMLALLPLARRIWRSTVVRVVQFAGSALLLSVVLMLLGIMVGGALETRWFPRGGHVVFLAAPLVGPVVATIASGIACLSGPRRR